MEHLTAHARFSRIGAVGACLALYGGNGAAIGATIKNRAFGPEVHMIRSGEKDGK